MNRNREQTGYCRSGNRMVSAGYLFLRTDRARKYIHHAQIIVM